MLPRSFYFLRHGETDWNKQELLQGNTDIPLNDNGRAQAKSAAPFFLGLPIKYIVTSTLSRAQETAEIVNRHLKLDILFEDNIRERHFGDLEGQGYEHFQRLKKEAAEKKLIIEENGLPCPPNAEPYADFKQRCINGFQTHLSSLNDNILFISHGGVHRSLQRSLNIPDLRQSGNCEPFQFLKQDTLWHLQVIGQKNNV